MPSHIGKLKYLFLILLIISCTGIIGYGVLYQIPQQKCEKAQGWWSFKYRKCYAPIYLPSITGRKPGEPDKSNVTVDFHEEARTASNAKAVAQAAKASASASASR
jgi:hypothetical protein